MKEYQKPKFTDEERHRRFVETAKNVEASVRPEDFDNAFRRIAKPKKPHSSESQERRKMIFARGQII